MTMMTTAEAIETIWQALERPRTILKIDIAIPIQAIAAQVARKHRVSLRDLMSTKRCQRIANARLETYWRARQETSASYPEIGYVLGRHHTTVLAGVRAYEKRHNALISASPGV